MYYTWVNINLNLPDISFLDLYFSFYWGSTNHHCSLPSRLSILWLINQSSTKRKLLHLPFLLPWVDEISLQRLPYGKITKKSAIWLYPNYGFVYPFLMIPTYFVVWFVNQLDWIVRTISPDLHTTYWSSVSPCSTGGCAPSHDWTGRSRRSQYSRGYSLDLKLRE